MVVVSRIDEAGQVGRNEALEVVGPFERGRDAACAMARQAGTVVGTP
jgi:hypothetical protein